jgi:hypothetical protein
VHLLLNAIERKLNRRLTGPTSARLLSAAQKNGREEDILAAV